MRTLLDTIPVGVVAVDAGGKVTMTNRCQSDPGSDVTGSVYETMGSFTLLNADGSLVTPKISRCAGLSRKVSRVTMLRYWFVAKMAPNE